MPRSARFIARLAGAALALTLGTGAGAQCTMPGCVLVWADEFVGTELNPAKWEHQIGDGCPNLCGWGNNERQFYRAENTSVADGLLTITAREESFGGYAYTSSRLRTRGLGDFRYGRFEMRAKLPSGQGMWPAFWMLPTDPSIYGVWAASGEIDIMEAVGDEPDRVFGTIHYGDTFPGNLSSSTDYVLPSGDFQNEFHDFAVEWEPGEIRWYVDGSQYASRSSWFSTGGPYPAPFDVDFHLLLNLAVGGNLPGDPDATTVFPQELVVDYVRVYQSEPSIGPRIFDDMDHGSPFDNGWFSFNGSVGGGGIGPSFDDLPPEDGGTAALGTGWGSGGTPGFVGGFGRNRALELTDVAAFSFWIDPAAGDDYLIEINLQDDDNGDGRITPESDDEWQYTCEVRAGSACAEPGGGWQRVTIPLEAFVDDNSFLFGGNGVLDAVFPSNGGNGALRSVVLALISQSGADLGFRTDYWVFERPAGPDSDGDGVVDDADNCLALANPGQEDSNGDGFGNACDADIAGAAGPGADDCQVNFSDLGALSTAFFSNPASPQWNPDADLTGPGDAPDGLVNFLDLGRMKTLFFAAPGPSGVASGCP